MIWLSEVLLEHHALNNFDELIDVIKQKAKTGEMFFRMDIKPTFPDTPNNWEDRLEAAFTAALDESN